MVEGYSCRDADCFEQSVRISIITHCDTSPIAKFREAIFDLWRVL